MKDQNITLVIKNPAALKNIKKPALDVCLAALMQDGLLIGHIDTSLFTRREYFTLCRAAVKSNPKAFALIQRDRLVSGAPEDLMLLAVEYNGLALRWLKEQTPELCLKAVKQNPKALAYVDKAMCDAASPHCYALLQEAAQEEKAKKRKEPRAKVSGENGKQEPKIDLRDIDRQSEEICLKAVQQDGLQLKYVHRQTRKICLAAFKQNPNAQDFVRNNDLVAWGDLFFVALDALVDMLGSFSSLAFYAKSAVVKEIPEALKKSTKQSYYSRCQKAVEDNACNIGHINPALLSAEQYKDICIKAVKETPEVISFIGEADIDQDLYFEICRTALIALEESRLDRYFSKIQSSRLSNGQYFRLVEILFKSFSESRQFLLLLDTKKFTNTQYFEICRKIQAKGTLKLEQIQSGLLTKEQYSRLCFVAIKKGHSSISDLDRKRLQSGAWLELCKTAVRKQASYLYCLDVHNGKDFKELLTLALRNGVGLKYIALQNYRQCLAVVRKNALELGYVRPEQLSLDEYFTICKTAVEKDPNSLRHVDDKSLDIKQYNSLCAAAVKSFPGAIHMINREKIPERLYNSWCKKAVNNSPHWIRDVPFSEHYFDLCLKAVKKDGAVLEDVKYLRLTPEQYATVREASAKHEKKQET